MYMVFLLQLGHSLLVCCKEGYNISIQGGVSPGRFAVSVLGPPAGRIGAVDTTPEPDLKLVRFAPSEGCFTLGSADPRLLGIVRHSISGCECATAVSGTNIEGSRPKKASSRPVHLAYSCAHAVDLSPKCIDHMESVRPRFWLTSRLALPPRSHWSWSSHPTLHLLHRRHHPQTQPPPQNSP